MRCFFFVLPFSSLSINRVQSSSLQWNTAYFSAVQCNAVKFSAVQCSAVQCSAVQCSVLPSRCGWGGSSDAINSACGTGHSQNTWGSGEQRSGKKLLCLCLFLCLYGLYKFLLKRLTKNKHNLESLCLYLFRSHAEKFNVSCKTCLKF